MGRLPYCERYSVDNNGTIVQSLDLSWTNVMKSAIGWVMVLFL